VFSAGAVVLTPPVPQSLAILKAGAVPLQPETRARLEGIEYERCLALMAVLAGPSRLAPPGGLAPDDGPIAWIADNQLKGISAEPAVTIHATHAFSLEHWERDRQKRGRRRLDAANDWLGAEVRTFQVHGWLYSKPLRVDEHSCAIMSQVPPLVLAGDAFAGPRVEGAALSGWAAAEAVLAVAP
jgi:predicted NAD/FAD-dependent oxidoreductase